MVEMASAISLSIVASSELSARLRGTQHAPATTMENFKHILVATDFGSASDEAVEAATKLGLAFEAKITVLHAWEIPIYPYMESMLNSALLVDVEARAAKRLAEVLAKVRAFVPNADSVLVAAPPWSAILDTISDVKPDLVVVGSHGHRGVARALLGSVAEKVVRLSPVPVLTVKSAPN